MKMRFKERYRVILVAIVVIGVGYFTGSPIQAADLDSVTGQLLFTADPTFETPGGLSSPPMVYIALENMTIERMQAGGAYSDCAQYFLLDENDELIVCNVGSNFIYDPFNSTPSLYGEYTYCSEITVYGEKGIIEVYDDFLGRYLIKNTIKIDHIELVRECTADDFPDDPFDTGDGEEPEGPPNPIFMDISYPEKVKPGESFEILTVIENEGSTGVIWGQFLQDGVDVTDPLGGDFAMFYGQISNSTTTKNISKTTEFTFKVGHYDSQNNKVTDDIVTFTITCEDSAISDQTHGFELILAIVAIALILFLKRKRMN